MIKYITTDNIHKFFGCHDNYNGFKFIVSNIKNEFKYGDPLFESGYNDHIYFLAIDYNKLIGVLKFKIGGQDSCSNPGFKNWICFIEVHKNYRNQGIGKKLREMLFKHCADNNLNILSSGFTLLGHKYNLKGYIELAKKYKIEYAYKEGVGHPNFHNFEGMDEIEYKEYYEKNKPDFWYPETIIINKKEKIQ